MEHPTHNTVGGSTNHNDYDVAQAHDSSCLYRYDKLGLDQQTRAEIGRKSKRILDWARCQFIMESTNLQNVRLKYYVDQSVSPENVVLLAS